MGTRAAALKRWSRPSQRQEMARLMRLRFRPKLPKFPKLKEFPKGVPRPLVDLIDTLGNEAIEVVDYGYVTVSGHRVWGVTVTDGTAIGMHERYTLHADAAGLGIYHIFHRPLRQGGGISAVIFVGMFKGDD